MSCVNISYVARRERIRRLTTEADRLFATGSSVGPSSLFGRSARMSSSSPAGTWVSQSSEMLIVDNRGLDCAYDAQMSSYPLDRTSRRTNQIVGPVSFGKMHSWPIGNRMNGALIGRRLRNRCGSFWCVDYRRYLTVILIDHSFVRIKGLQRPWESCCIIYRRRALPFRGNSVGFGCTNPLRGHIAMYDGWGSQANHVTSKVLALHPEHIGL